MFLVWFVSCQFAMICVWRISLFGVTINATTQTTHKQTTQTTQTTQTNKQTTHKQTTHKQTTHKQTTHKQTTKMASLIERTRLLHQDQEKLEQFMMQEFLQKPTSVSHGYASFTCVCFLFCKPSRHLTL